MGDVGHVVEGHNLLHMAQPNFLAVNGLVGALVRHAVLGVLPVVLECERHAVHVAQTYLLQSIVGHGGVGVVALTLHVLLTQGECQRSLAVATTTDHVGDVVRVVVVVHHIGTVDEFLSDAARLQDFVHHAGVAPRSQIHRPNTEHNGATYHGAAGLPVCRLAQLQAAVLDGDKSCLFHFLISIKKLSFHYTGRIAFWVYRVISRFSLEVFLHLVAAQRLRRNCRSDSIWLVHALLYLIALVFYTKPLRFSILNRCGLLY